MYNAPVRSISRAELQLKSLMTICVEGTKIVKLDLRGCPILKYVYGADQASRKVLTTKGVKCL